MGTEAEKAVHEAQSNQAAPLSTTSTGKKTSMFSKKIGFVIPKNKLSGSLVPVFKATKKGNGDPVNDEAPHKTQRKTKWGADLSQDTSVRKGRILAYQTRINQISQQLTLGSLEIEDNEDPSSTSEFNGEKSSDHEFNAEKSELLELERREIIGELLKLNPSYKAPAGYKPILKEAKVPIPIKEYPGHDFIGLVYGPANDTQKRLEKETGARIRVFGSKADSGGKIEVTPTDGKDILNTYKDLYVHISADTFEKVDAAVALIELLVTPVSVNPSSSLSTSTTDENAVPSSIITPPLTNQVPRFLPPPQVHIPQYSQPWLSTGPPSLYGPQPVMPRNFSPVPRNPSNVPFSPQLPNPPNRPFIPVSPIGTLPSQPLSIRPAYPPVFQASSSTPNPNAPSMAIPRPLRPSSSDFTFLPHRPPIQNMHSPATPQFLRPMAHNNHMNQPRAQMSTNFRVSPPAPQFPPRHPIFMNPNNSAPFSPHMQPRNNFIPPQQIYNSAGPAPFPQRLENLQNQRFGAQIFPNSNPNQPFGNQPRRPFGGVQQSYDPFSPTSVPFNNSQIRGNPGKVQDGNDPEYEDLMASVGVK